MPHLKSIEWKRRPAESAQPAFPWSIPAIRSLDSLAFNPAVTFFVGENGSGKSTLLETIATAAHLPTVGGDETDRDESLAAQRRLAGDLRLKWTRRARRGFFLRAEDFFGFQKRVVQQQRDLKTRLAEVEVDYADASPTARGLAAGPAAGELHDIIRRYGENPDARSHGEAFIHLFRSRFVPGGLYLLDEPEAALSPQSQLALLTMMFDMLGEEAQFIVATHSPILLAFPGATIYSFDHTPIRVVPYDDLEHVKLTRDFLENPGRFLRALKEQS